MTQCITVAGTELKIQIYEDLFTIPCLEGRFDFRKAADGIAHPMTSGRCDQQLDLNRFAVERVNEPIFGHGDHDGDHYYRIGAATVSAAVVEQLRKLGVKIAG